MELAWPAFHPIRKGTLRKFLYCEGYRKGITPIFPVDMESACRYAECAFWEALVRTSFSVLLVGVLGVAFGGASVMAAPAPSVASPAGVIVQADHASLGHDAAANGTSVFDGDRLATEASGSLRLRFGASQAYLTPQSSAVIHPSAQGFGADLTGGTIVVSSALGERFDVLADGAQIHPATGQPTVAQVTMVSANELILSSRKGALEVAVEGEMKTVPEGSSYRMIIQPPDPATPPQTQQAGRNRVIWILIIGLAAATGIIVGLALMSPSGL